ncbi:hypothetical protein CXU13_05560 [Akkermansia muciniphila]|nr:hypothetical protein CXU13_05560 [Akkermansia muciniphila]
MKAKRLVITGAPVRISIESGEWRVESGEWRVESGEWGRKEKGGEGRKKEGPSALGKRNGP